MRSTWNGFGLDSGIEHGIATECTIFGTVHVYSFGRYVASIGESSATGTDVIVSSSKGGRVID